MEYLNLKDMKNLRATCVIMNENVLESAKFKRRSVFIISSVDKSILFELKNNSINFGYSDTSRIFE